MSGVQIDSGYSEDFLTWVNTLGEEWWALAWFCAGMFIRSLTG